MKKKYIILIVVVITITTLGIGIIIFNSIFTRYPNTLSEGEVPVLCLPIYNFTSCDAIQGYGQIADDFYHNGIDFGVNATTTIVSPHDAYIETIKFWYNDKGGHWQTNVRLWLNYQWRLEIVFESWALNESYGQKQRDAIIVQNGQYVKANQSLGNLLVHGPGAHIHFGVYYNGNDKCPYNYFSSEAKVIFENIFYRVNYTRYWCM
ncbi:MAG: hypothetical protein ACTSPQ_18115 [Candidatus Helarchaeota archaeon]